MNNAPNARRLQLTQKEKIHLGHGSYDKQLKVFPDLQANDEKLELNSLSQPIGKIHLLLESKNPSLN
jgi:cell division septal protein FtsQ